MHGALRTALIYVAGILAGMRCRVSNVIGQSRSPIYNKITESYKTCTRKKLAQEFCKFFLVQEKLTEILCKFFVQLFKFLLYYFIAAERTLQ